MGNELSNDIIYNISNNCLIISISDALTLSNIAVLVTFVKQVLECQTINSLVLDFNSTNIIDYYTANALNEVIAITQMLGKKPIIMGLKPGLVFSLLDFGLDFQLAAKVKNLDQAFALANG